MWSKKGFAALGFGIVSLTGIFTYATTRQEMGSNGIVVNYPLVPINNNNNNTPNNGACPVNHNNNNNNINKGECPVNHGKNNTLENQNAPPTPVNNNAPSHGAESSSLVPTNQMPPPNQQPHADQRAPLPIQRLKSSIPKVDGNNWEYPSEQMFYNALKRKGWEGYSEEDMKGIVSVHNVTNERCWAEILKWELTLHDSKDEPKLVRFRGNYDKTSPKAYMKMIFGGVQRPFDRHDWIVNRDGNEVRYVIDFYEGVKMQGKASTIHLDIRPAIDSPTALLDRVRMYFGITKDIHQVIAERANRK